MGYMDQLCSGCQAGMCDGDHGGPSDPQDELRRCIECRETFNIRSAALGSRMCPRCARHERQRRR